MTFTAENKKFIDLLVAQGYNLVVIDDTLFIITSTFNPADEILNKTTVMGKDITDLVGPYTHVAGSSTLQLNELLNKINELSNVRREYSKDYSWITYTRV